MSTPTERVKQPKKAAIAAWIGSTLEYYDFFVYGTVAALVFPKIFFNPDDPSTATLASLATFGVAYVARPFGSFVMGHVGDRLGRKTVMVSTLMMMGASTFLIGCLPTYKSIGLWAPALLVLLRLLQGFSASGEQAGANAMSFENAPENRRGYYTSWTMSGTVGGQVIAPAVVLILTALLSDDQMLSWGWRIPFWLSAIVVVVGYLIRRTLDETPAFEAEEDAGNIPSVPLRELFQHHWRGVIRVFFASTIASIGTVFSVFGLAFATGSSYHIGVGKTPMLWLAIVSNFIAIFSIPWFASISDRIGRKKVFISGITGCAFFSALFLWSVSMGNVPLMFITGILLNTGVFGMTNAVWPSTYAEIFPTRVRLSGTAIGTQFGFALAGFAPSIAVALAGGRASGWIPVAILVAAICLISGTAVAFGRETHDIPMDKLGRRATGTDAVAEPSLVAGPV